MNYSQLAKNEVVKLGFSTDCCKKAFLSAVIHSAGSVVISGKVLAVEIYSENDELLKKAAALIEEFYAVTPDMSKNRKLIVAGDDAMTMMTDVGIFCSDGGHTVVQQGIMTALVINKCCAVNYIRGVFLGSGSLSARKGYHLEFGLSNRVFSSDFSALLGKCGIPSHIIPREKKIVVYVKGSEAVCDCLALMGASVAVLRLNDELVYRDVRKNSNRINNCEYANIGKTVDAAVRQLDAIKLLKRKKLYERLSDKLKQVAQVRVDNPEMSLSELSLLTGIARSTIKNRLNKIVEYADDIKENIQ